MTAGNRARAAAVVAARARLVYAQRLLRKATRAVAQADDGFDTYAHAHLTSRNSTDAQALVDAAIAEHDEIDVVVLIAIPPSITAPEGAQTERTT